MNVRRDVVEVDALEVHVREAGAGAPVLLIHECPRSSLTVVPLLEQLAARGLRAIAIDLPGFGLSERLRIPEPQIADLAEHVAATLDALQVRRCGVYGMHTGAKVALELAHRRPRAVAGLVLDGLSMNPPNPAFRPGEGYLAGFVPRQDGAHLAELWSRERDQYRFYPWHERSLRTRLPWPLPDASAVQAHLLDLLLAGPDFGGTYVAPYRYAGAESVARVSVPTEIVCRADDLLFPHLDRLPRLPPHCTVRRLAADADAWLTTIVDAMRRFADSEAAGGSAPRRASDSAAAAPAASRLPAVSASVDLTRPRRRRYVHTHTGLQSVHEYAPERARVVLALPPFPGAAATDRLLYAGLAQHARVIVPDLPGCGDADALPGGGDPLAGVAERLAGVLHALDARRVILFAPELTHDVALGFAQRHQDLVEHVVLDGADLDTDLRAAAVRALPDLTPQDFGEHLHRAWHLLRDQSLAWPWFRRDAAAVRRVAPALDAERLHTALVELFKAPRTTTGFWTALWQAHPTMRGLGIPVTRTCVPGDPASATLGSDGEACRVLERQADAAGLLDVLISLVARVRVHAAAPDS